MPHFLPGWDVVAGGAGVLRVSNPDHPRQLRFLLRAGMFY